MLPRENRIQKKKEIDEVFKKGKSFKEGPFLFKILKKEEGVPRVGIIISQKVSKKAVLRNKIRRQLNGLLGKELDRNLKQADVLIVCLPAAKDKSFKEMEEIITKALKKV